MGIQRLIPFLEKSSKPVHISQFAGCTVAIDAYCWLHRGAFCCADKLARGDKTDLYVNYCMKYVNMLLSQSIKPILVFDGRHLPAKADTEKKRRQNREVNRRRAAELLRQDKPNEARTFLQRCVDVTHEMALELMRVCRSRNVDCITAPFEADAQLAYLNINNIAHVVITEDSDLLLFGCVKVVFKLDLNGNGLLVEQDNLHLAMGLSKGCFSLDKFRHMCILAGCDYLPSLRNIGLAKACRFIKSTVDPDIHRALSRLGSHLNMNLVVTREYRDKFMEAEAMFRHQPVYDPLRRRLVPLTPVPPGATPPPLLTSETLAPDEQLQLALGNLDPFTLEKVDDWSPDGPQMTSGQTSGWNVKLIAPHKSIWSPHFKPKALVMEQPDPCQVKRSSTTGRVVERAVDIPNLPAKRPLHSVEEELNELRMQFGASPRHPSKKACHGDDSVLDKSDRTPSKREMLIPGLMESPKKSQVNPFTKMTPTVGNKFSGLSKLAQFRKTTFGEKNVVQSRYFNSFCSSEQSQESDNGKLQNNTLKDVNNIKENQTKIYDSSLDVKRTKKLSDSSITSLIQDLGEDVDEDVDEDKGPLKNSNRKENVSDDNFKFKSQNSFNWKPTLAEFYRFKSIKHFPPAVGNQFLTPLKDGPNFNKETDCSVTTFTTEQKNKACKRNPFAKAMEIRESSCSLGSQGSSPSYSQSNILTPETVSSEEPNVLPIIPTSRLPVKVGLNKKQSDGCQLSLLYKFAFKPKSKCPT